MSLALLFEVMRTVVFVREPMGTAELGAAPAVEPQKTQLGPTGLVGTAILLSMLLVITGDGSRKRHCGRNGCSQSGRKERRVLGVKRSTHILT